jgi:broad specificity phosphatase PhoE
MKLIIVRHGETEENAKGIIQGHLPGKLTEKGIQQAKKLANRLKDEKLDLIVSSDLARALDTANEIKSFHPEVPFQLSEELREIYQGELQGKYRSELPGWDIREKRELIKKEAGVETTEDLMLRGKKFIDKIIEGNNGKTILLIGHGAINTAIVSNLLDKDWAGVFHRNTPKNTSVTIFEFDEDNNPELKLMNCIKHLEYELQQ